MTVQKEYEIVATNGVPLNTAGWLAPVVRCGERCFMLGAAPATDFAAEDLPALAKDSHILLIQPKTIQICFGDPLWGHREDVRESIFSLPWYVFYVKRIELAALEQKLDVPLGETCASYGIALNAQNGENLLLRLIDCPTLRGVLLKALFEALRAGLHRHLRSALGKTEFDASLADQASSLLYQLAYDRGSAREAIALRTLASAFQPGADVCLRWTLRAAEAWGLERLSEYWVARVNETVHILWIQRQFHEAIPSIDVDTIGVRVLEELRNWAIGRFKELLAQESVTDNSFDECNKPSIPPIKLWPTGT